MKKYPEYEDLDLSAINKEVLYRWEKDRVFEKSIIEREGKPSFTFYEGPPSANGLPGIHHVLSRTIKDIFCRYKTQKGFQVKRKAGWDTHGLPVELSVEKSLGITKEDIGKSISIEDYNKECRLAVMKYKDVWDDLTKKMGFWLDLEHPYITYNNDYIESLWWCLKQLFDKGYLYKGYAVQPYSPAAGTGLSSHELNLPGCYKNVKDVSVTAQFKVKKDEKSNKLFDIDDEEVFFLAWTTTPWTLPSNCALAVGENITYVKIKTFNQYTNLPVSLIIAKKQRLDDYFSKSLTISTIKGYNQNVTSYVQELNLGYEAISDPFFSSFSAGKNILKLTDYEKGDKFIPWEICNEFAGSELEGIYYEQLMPYVKPKGDAFRVILGDFVSTEEGTGIVHTASVFGADDFRVCRQNNVPSILVKDEDGNDIPLVDKQGRFVKEVTDFSGKYVRDEYEKPETLKDPGYKSTDVLIAIKLKKENKAFIVGKYEHSYPHCWRTDKPILYYPLNSWFIKTTAVKEKMIELNKTINWKPSHTGSGRFGNWLENLVDWNLSRSRFWGTPLPIWISEDQKEIKCIGSVAELKNEIEKSIQAGFMKEPLKDNFDLHRPFVDRIVLVSSSGNKMFREPDLIDVWFDSGAMPYAQFHYPFENKEVFEKNYPADFIAEGVDQTRGWFFTLHAIAVMLFGSVAFKNVVSNGLVLDKTGNKMSKRIGNAADPFETIETYGADPARWYMITNTQPWDNLKFDVEGINEARKKFFGTLYNTYSFFAMYANIDGFAYKEKDVPYAKRPELDRWIISLLNSLIREVDNHYGNYEPTKAARAIQEFVSDHLSNWYVRLSRRKFWKAEYAQDKISAYQTLYRCLETTARLSAPVAPFFMDRLFTDLNNISQETDLISVHLTDFPKTDSSIIDADLVERMKLAQDVSSMVLAIRKKEGINVRQPLSKIIVPVISALINKQLESVENLILSEVNVKKLEYIKGDAEIIIKKAKPNFKTLGPKYGKLMKPITDKINEFGKKDIETIEAGNTYEFMLKDERVVITPQDVEIVSQDIPGWASNSIGNLTVALDINITKELKEEGIARELVNKIQHLRKDNNFEVTDKITLRIEKNDAINDAINNNLKYICTETLAASLELAVNVDEGTPVEASENVVIKIAINNAN